MKFSCDSCGRKYRIEDEKVHGKTLRMDCRKCGKKILIDGKRLTATTSDRPPTARPPAASSPLTKGFYDQVSSPQPSAGGGLGAREPKHWHVEINNVAVGPIGRSEVARKIETGAVKFSSLCWREGFDDWRPLHTVSELAALLQPAKPPSPVRIRNSTPPPPPPRTTGNRAAGPRPAAIGGRAGASAAVAMAPSPLSSQPERESQPEPKPFSSVPAPTPAPIASLPPLVSDAPSPGRGPFAPDPTMDLDMDGDGQTMVDAPGAFAPGPSTLTSEPPPFGRRKAGPPLMLYVAGGAAALFLMAIGIFIGVRFLSSPVPEQATPEPTKEQVVSEEPKGPEIEVPIEETGEPDDAVDEPSSETTVRANNTRRAVRATNTKKTNNEPELTEEEKRRIAQFGGGGSINLKSGSSGSSSSRSGGGRQLTESQIRTVVTKNYRNVQRCYERAIRGMGKVPAFRLDAKVTISGAGRVSTINVSGNDVGGLKSCITGAVRTWRFPGTGATTETSIPFVFREVG